MPCSAAWKSWRLSWIAYGSSIEQPHQRLERPEQALDDTGDHSHRPGGDRPLQTIQFVRITSLGVPTASLSLICTALCWPSMVSWRKPSPNFTGRWIFPSHFGISAMSGLFPI
jgi:hypothetical protein